MLQLLLLVFLMENQLHSACDVSLITVHFQSNHIKNSKKKNMLALKHQSIIVLFHITVGPCECDFMLNYKNLASLKSEYLAIMCALRVEDLGKFPVSGFEEGWISLVLLHLVKVTGKHRQ